MLLLSDILIQEFELDSFEELVKLVQARARDGEIHFRIDVRPPFQDTPEDWEERLEAAFALAPK